MTWGIALVLEHCVGGIEALIAGAQHGLWRHGSCFLLSNRYSICLFSMLNLQILAESGEMQIIM